MNCHGFFAAQLIFYKNLYKVTKIRYIVFVILKENEMKEYGTDKKTEKCKTV